ncbi:MAG: hypothetical protein WB869_10125 [Candidatus Acidiferrales bacterium]
MKIEVPLDAPPRRVGKPKVGALRGILEQRCPRCRVGKIYGTAFFHLPARMHERCGVCGLKFEREEGYFLGAMQVDYGLGVAGISLLALVTWLLTRWSFSKTVIAALLLFLPLVPALTRLGRIVWIWFDQSVDPERR